MPTELLLAPPASGKTTTCVQRIQALRRESPLASVRVIVPDRLQASAFRQRLAEQGGALGTHVGRFDDLYADILQRAGASMRIAPPPLQQRLIASAVDEAIDAGRLPYLAPLQPFPGFVPTLREVFTDLKRGMVTPAAFAEAVQDAGPTQRDLATLYALYQQRLESLGWMDRDDAAARALGCLRGDPQTCPPIQLLIVDGFDSFDQSQRLTLQALAALVGELLVTLPGSDDCSRPAHHRFRAHMQWLVHTLAPKVTGLTNTLYMPAEFRHIERNLFETQPEPLSGADLLTMLEVRSPAGEAREALRWIKQRVVRDGLSLRDCAIFTPNADAYHPALRSAAAEFGIPIHFTLDERLKSSPLIASLINLLNLPMDGFNSRSLMHVLRSPYFEFGLTGEEVDTLERISRVAQIVEGQEQWREAWSALEASTERNTSDLDDERNAPPLPRGSDGGELHRKLSAIFRLITPPGEPLTMTGWIDWLEALSERLSFYQRIESEAEQAAGEVLVEVMRGLALAEQVAGQVMLPFEGNLAQFQSALEAERYRETMPFDLPVLRVGRIFESRGMRYKAVALLGLSEGSFPSVERADPFLDEPLRAKLGLEPRLGREQAGLFYQAVTRADRFFLVTRPYLSDDGEPWEESAYWAAVKNLYDEKPGIVKKVNPDACLPTADAASTQELLFSAVRRKRLPGKAAHLMPRWDALRHAQSVLKARRAHQAEGLHEGQATSITSQLYQRYGPNRVWSPTGLETYGSCPFQFYISRCLELEALGKPELGVDVRQRGSMLHQILEQVFRSVGDPHNQTAVLAALRQVARQVLASAPKKYGFRPSALWGVEQAEMLTTLENTVIALVQDQQWTPIAFEQKFGLESLSPLAVEVDGEVMLIHGVIDRVDRNADGNLRVMDYKTGSSHHSPKDLYEGISLQLPIYALAAETALELGRAEEGVYWEINAAKAGSLKLSKVKFEDMTGIQAAYAVLKSHLEHSLNGIRQGDFAPHAPRGGCPEYCPARTWCWRYERGW